MDETLELFATHLNLQWSGSGKSIHAKRNNKLFLLEYTSKQENIFTVVPGVHMIAQVGILLQHTRLIVHTEYVIENMHGYLADRNG